MLGQALSPLELAAAILQHPFLPGEEKREKGRGEEEKKGEKEESLSFLSR